MSDKPIIERTDPEILGMLGARMRSLRKTAGLTILEAARRTELDRSTISELEKGGNSTLLTVIRLLRTYGRLPALDGFIPSPEVSPMSILREKEGRWPRGGPDG